MPAPRSAPDRTAPPAPGPIRPFHLSPAHADALDNGLRLRFLARGEVPLVSGCLVLDAGETGVPEGLEGVAVLTGDSLQGGTELRSAAEFAEELERLGTSFRVSTGWDATTVTFTCIAERLTPVLDLLAEAVRRPAFPEDEVERVREQRLAAIRQRRMDPGELADDELDRAVFTADHPYHRPLSGSAESVSGLTPEHARAIAREGWVPERGGLVLVGDLSVDAVSAEAERHFGDWDSPYPGRRALQLAEAPAVRRVVVVDRPGAVQSEIRIGHPAPARGHPDEFAIQVVNGALGGVFTSRLNLNLREKHGFTYGVHSRFAHRRNGGAFTISTAVQTEVTGAALREAMHELERMAAEGPEQEELERVRDYLAGVFPLRMETTAQLAARTAELLIFDLPEDYHHRYRDRIREVELEAAQGAAARHFLPGAAAVVVVGDAGRVLPEVEALELGAVEVVQP